MATGRGWGEVLMKGNKPALLGERWRRGNPEEPKWSTVDVERRCPLSQSAGKLRGAVAPHGWVGGQGATHCVGLTGGPWVNTATRRRWLGGPGSTGRPPTQNINLIRDDHACIPTLLFSVLFPGSGETGQWLLMSAIRRPFWQRRASRRQIHCCSSLSRRWNSPSFTTLLYSTSEEVLYRHLYSRLEKSILWCHNDVTSFHVVASRSDPIT